MKRKSENRVSEIIVNNRIVSSHTYATRYLSFLGDLYDTYPHSGPMQEEEFEYMCYVACDLLKKQVDLEPDPGEVWYFKNLYPNYTCAEDIIREHICKFKPGFYTYLKAIRAI